MINTTGGPVKLRNGVFLGRALAFDGQVLPEPLELKHTPVGAVNQPCACEKTSYASSIGSFLKVGDYPELIGPLRKLLHQYCNAIALPSESLGTTDTTEHKIRVKPDTKPLYIPAYRLPHSQREVVDEQVKDMLEQGVIQHSRSPLNSSLLLVPKKDGSFRPVIDFRKVSEVTEDDRYPLPVLGDLLMSLRQGNTIISSLDFLSGYWQVPMAAESREITAFSTPSGHFEWLLMAFGLKTAPITFQKMINTLFSDLIGKGVYAYLNDLIICSKDGDSHLGKLEAVLLKLKEAGLKAKLAKNEFLMSKITFLGYTIDGDGIHTMDDKNSAIKNFPQPQNLVDSVVQR